MYKNLPLSKDRFVGYEFTFAIKYYLPKTRKNEETTDVETDVNRRERGRERAMISRSRESVADDKDFTVASRAKWGSVCVYKMGKIVKCA